MSSQELWMGKVEGDLVRKEIFPGVLASLLIRGRAACGGSSDFELEPL